MSPRQGHYLAFGVDEEIPHAGRSALQIAEAVRKAGGIGFAAHPFSSGGRMLVPPLARRIVLPHGGPAPDVDVQEVGRYRVEGRINGRLWLLSNHVYLR